MGTAVRVLPQTLSLLCPTPRDQGSASQGPKGPPMLLAWHWRPGLTFHSYWTPCPKATPAAMARSPRCFPLLCFCSCGAPARHPLLSPFLPGQVLLSAPALGPTEPPAPLPTLFSASRVSESTYCWHHCSGDLAASGPPVLRSRCSCARQPDCALGRAFGREVTAALGGVSRAREVQLCPVQGLCLN